MNRYQHYVAIIILPWGRRTHSLQISHLQNRYLTKTYLNEVAKHCFSWYLIATSHYQFIHHLNYPVQFMESTFYILFSPNWAEYILPNHLLSLGDGLNCSFESPRLWFLSMSSLKTMKYKPVYYSCIHVPIKYLLLLFILIKFKSLKNLLHKTDQN